MKDSAVGTGDVGKLWNVAAISSFSSVTSVRENPECNFFLIAEATRFAFGSEDLHPDDFNRLSA